MITIDAIGLDAATAQISYIKEALSFYQGCYYRGSTRDDGQPNSAIIKKLTDGPPRRDLSTLSDEHASTVSDAFKTEIERRIATQWGEGALEKAKAMGRAQSAAAWKAAGKVVLRMLNERIKQNLSADESGALSSAETVRPGYAAKRKAMYGVSENEVYKASGQLMNDCNESNVGGITLVRGSGKSI